MAWAYLNNGDFEEAERLQLQAIDDLSEFDTLWQIFPYLNLLSLFFQKGEFDEAEDLLESFFKISKSWDYTYGIYVNWTVKGFLLEVQGQLLQALNAHNKSLELRIQTGHPNIIFTGHYIIFRLYYDGYRATKDPALFKKIEPTLTILRKLAEENPNQASMKFISRFSEGLLLKFGNIRAKAKPIDIFEGLLRKDPNNISYILVLLDSLFEDVSISMDPDSVQQTENLIGQLKKISVRSNPQAIFEYISQQMVLADYSYYIEGDPSTALQILEGSRKHLIGRKLHHLSKIIVSKIEKLSGELEKWENIDLSIKDRIVNSKISDYLQDAIKLMKKSM